jgi:hypothetical protein
MIIKCSIENRKQVTKNIQIATQRNLPRCELRTDGKTIGGSPTGQNKKHAMQHDNPFHETTGEQRHKKSSFRLSR